MRGVTPAVAQFFHPSLLRPAHARTHLQQPPPLASPAPSSLVLGPKLGRCWPRWWPTTCFIIVGALAGVMHAMGKITHTTRTAAALYVIKWVGTAVFLTGAASVAIEQAFNFPATRWPGVVAFCSPSWPTSGPSGCSALWASAR